MEESGGDGRLSIRAGGWGGEKFGAAIIRLGGWCPEQPPSPVEIPPRIEVARDRLAKLRTTARRDRNAPDGAVGELAKRDHIPDRPPECSGSLVIERGRFAIGPQFGQQPIAPEIDRARRTLDPQR